MKMTSVLLLMILCFSVQILLPQGCLFAAWSCYSDGGGDLNQYKQLDREAHCPGYQQGYHGEPENIETAKFSPSE